MINYIKSSFRDPSGRVFLANGEVFRLVSKRYKDNYSFLMSSGLYEHLTDSELLVKHVEVDEGQKGELRESFSEEVYKVIKPEKVPFISYPYEWCFSQLKDAAIATLEIELTSLKYGMTLKDASAYNIQFIGSKPIFIDTLSFEIYEEGKSWVAYRQFCKHFLAPLALMAYVDKRFYGIFKEYIDGVPLDFAANLLPLRTKFNMGLYMHIHLHAKVQRKFENAAASDKDNNKYFFKKQSLINLINSVLSTIKGLEYKKSSTEWGDYYNITNYSDASFENKKVIVNEFLDKLRSPAFIWDMGANNGFFSKIALSKGAYVTAFDIDFNAIEACYIREKNDNSKNILPLIMDLTNPSACIGWGCEERDSLVLRGGADAVMALALVHHLAISNNVPFTNIAEFFAKLGHFLIIEWVPKEDSQTQIILDGRNDIFDSYNEENFEQHFSKQFTIMEKQEIKGTKRILYLMERK